MKEYSHNRYKSAYKMPADRWLNWVSHNRADFKIMNFVYTARCVMMLSRAIHSLFILRMWNSFNVQQLNEFKVWNCIVGKVINEKALSQRRCEAL